MRNRNFRKCSSYLAINLAVIDMFVGGVAVYTMLYVLRVDCNLWKWHSIEYGIDVLRTLLLSGSFTNITIIALERVHAKFLPFRHRVLKKWVYGLYSYEVIICHI